MLPETDARVPAATSTAANRRIARRRSHRVHEAARSPEALRARLRELDREWDVERTLEANAGTLACLGAVLALTLDRRFAIVPAVVGGFLVQHALQGWCPPLPVLRRAGVRTAREIGGERVALQALRGDFDAVAQAGPSPEARAEAALQAATRRG
jgi:hypothetical protein